MGNIWSDDVKCSVVFTFDLDAETFWFSRNQGSYNSPSLLAEGSYGPNIGMPRILDMLDETGVKATFFIPGWVIENHIKIVKETVKRGHEIGYHGYLHERVNLLSEEKKRIARCKDIMKKKLDIEPVGYRAPEAELVTDVLKLIKESGFKYSSNFMDADSPYLHESGDSASLVELPTSWLFDDSSHFFFTLQEPARRPIAPPSTVFEIWKEEFDGIYEEGGSIVFMLHPQIIGRASRVRMLKKLIKYIQGAPGVLIGTGREVANNFLRKTKDRKTKDRKTEE